ncbi:hypothetical protein [Streptomyces venezuelae]|uniref:hypothetical protein n=1 Tax=Streptomyces venezuelae TaxID=54571 RepID=UPI00332E2D76
MQPLHLRRRPTGIPEAHAFVYRDPCGAWTIAARCPWCCQQHLPGAGHGPAHDFPADTVRCSGRSYSLTPLDPA